MTPLPPVSGATADVVARPRRAILVTLLVLAAAGWVVVVWQSGDDASMGMQADDAMGLDFTMGLAAPLFFAMWVAMMIAMMFPSAAPMVTMFDRVQRSRRDGGQSYVPTTYFVSAYLVVWVAFGAIAFALAALVDHLATENDWVIDEWQRIGGVLLVAAGLYQLTPLKEVCLRKCRTPISFLLSSWRDGKRGAVEMGLLHGTYCLGCCWLLFVILLPLGVMNVAAMVVIALLVFGEKCLPSGTRLARVAAVALIAYGLLVIAVPSALPTTLDIASGGMDQM